MRVPSRARHEQVTAPVNGGSASCRFASSPCIVALGLSTAARRPGTRSRIEKAADLPRFTYKIDGKLEDIVRDDAKFRRFAADVSAATRNRCSRSYEIDDRATLRQLQGDA